MAAQKKSGWDYEWNYTMGAPDAGFWDYPIGGGTAFFEDVNGLYLNAKATNDYAGIRALNCVDWLSQKAVYEIDVKVIYAAVNGIRIVLASGENGISDERGMQVTLNNDYLNVLTAGQNISEMNRSAVITYNQWHKVRLELDIAANNNCVYLDDNLVCMVESGNLSTQYATNVWLLAQIGEAYVRSIRYKKY